MKRLILILSILTVLLFVGGCGKKEDLQENKKTNDVNENIENPQINTMTAFEQFESNLASKNIAYEKVIIAAEMVGAAEGYKYKMPDGKVELYRFEKDSDALKSVRENKSITLEGFGSFPVSINDENKEIAILIDTENNNETILEIFNSIK